MTTTTDISPNDENRKWASCLMCHKRMAPGHGCERSVVGSKGTSYERIKVGDEYDFYPHAEEGDFCHDCNAGAGQYHHWGCDVERCPI